MVYYGLKQLWSVKMPSPFPGMDPFIENQKWPDFHTRLITAISDALLPAVRPKYVLEVERRVYLETRDPETTVQSFVADAGIYESGLGGSTTEASGDVAVAEATQVERRTCTLPYIEEHHEPYLTIRRGSPREIVTIIELLSPANKTRGSDGRQQYLDKRLALLKTRTHFVELDLLRGGERTPLLDPPAGDYFAIISQAVRRPAADVYGWPLASPLPTLPIPLADDDPDVPLNLQAVLSLVYDRAGYDYSLNYQETVSPAFSEAETTWAQKRIG